jgi:hypothetical protein
MPACTRPRSSWPANHGVNVVQTAVISIGDELVLVQVHEGQTLAVVELNMGKLIGLIVIFGDAGGHQALIRPLAGLPDHLVCLEEERRGDRQAERLRGLEVDALCVPRRPLDERTKYRGGVGRDRSLRLKRPCPP